MALLRHSSESGNLVGSAPRQWRCSTAVLHYERALAAFAGMTKKLRP
jgi:hypothetical protein